jgi:hypothetical protein
MEALAKFYRVKPASFTDDVYYETLDKELTWLTHMRDEVVRRIAAATVLDIDHEVSRVRPPVTP